MANSLRVGVIGLGRRWQRRYKPALLSLSEQFTLVALCDQVPQRATLALVDWCAHLLGNEPGKVFSPDTTIDGLQTLFLAFSEGRGARISRWRASVAHTALRLHVVAEHGSATVELPNHISWQTGDGGHKHTMNSSRSLGEMLLEEFHR